MKKTFLINDHELGVGPCYIIAEIGSNHDRDKGRALRMIRALAKAKVNAVKFQLFKADRISANIDIPETRLKDQFSKFGKTIYSLYKDMELPSSWLKELKACADECGVDFLVTPFDKQSVDEVVQIGVPAIKIASFEITHIPLLRHVARFKLPVLLSTGMANMKEVAVAMRTLADSGADRVGLFHCGIEYPVPLEAVHLRCMDTLRKAFSCPVGYSDHTQGLVVPVAAVALGANMFEKHVTDKAGKSPDHEFALSIEEFANLVCQIRSCEQVLGSSVKSPQPCEANYLRRGRRSLFVIKDVKRSDIFTTENLAVLRPGVGLPPSRFNEVIGCRSLRNIKAPAVLLEEDWE